MGQFCNSLDLAILQRPKPDHDDVTAIVARLPSPGTDAHRSPSAMGSSTKTLSRLLTLCGLLSLASVAYQHYHIVANGRGCGCDRDQHDIAEQIVRSNSKEVRDDEQSKEISSLRKELERLKKERQTPDGGGAGPDVLDELDAITRGTDDERDRRNCRAPKKFYRNRIVRSAERNEKRIPKIIHVGYRERCLPRDLHPFLERWEERFPEYSIFLHDREATERLFRRRAYPEFPGLREVLQCVLYDGAMSADIWRVLVLWLYGGIYTDIDVYPEDPFDDGVIPRDVSGLYFSQPRGWVSHWFQALEPRHRLMFDCMRTIIHNVRHKVDVTDPDLFRLTGPWVIRRAFRHFVTENDTVVEEKLKWVKPATFTGMDNQTILKVNTPGYRRYENKYVSHKKGFNKFVPHPFNETAKKIRRYERLELETVAHWPVAIERRKAELRRRFGDDVRSCAAYLKAVEEDPSLEVPKAF